MSTTLHKGIKNLGNSIEEGFFQTLWSTIITHSKDESLDLNFFTHFALFEQYKSLPSYHLNEIATTIYFHGDKRPFPFGTNFDGTFLAFKFSKFAGQSIIWFILLNRVIRACPS